MVVLGPPRAGSGGCSVCAKLRPLVTYALPGLASAPGELRGGRATGEPTLLPPRPRPGDKGRSTSAGGGRGRRGRLPMGRQHQSWQYSSHLHVQQSDREGGSRGKGKGKEHSVVQEGVSQAAPPRRSLTWARLRTGLAARGGSTRRAATARIPATRRRDTPHVQDCARPALPPPRWGREDKRIRQDKGCRAEVRVWWACLNIDVGLFCMTIKAGNGGRGGAWRTRCRTRCPHTNIRKEALAVVYARACVSYRTCPPRGFGVALRVVARAIAAHRAVVVNPLHARARLVVVAGRIPQTTHHPPQHIHHQHLATTRPQKHTF